MIPNFRRSLTKPALLASLLLAAPAVAQEKPPKSPDEKPVVGAEKLGPSALKPKKAKSDAAGLLERTYPAVWVDQFTPEDLPKLELPAYLTPVERAAAEADAGRYKLALNDLYLAQKHKQTADPVAFALAKGRALHGLQRWDAALAVLSENAVAGDPKVQVLRARVLADAGKPAEAVEVLRGTVAKHPKDIASHFYLALYEERLGRTDAAAKGYEWFVGDDQEFLSKWKRLGPSGFDSAGNLTLIARGIDRWARLTASYVKLPELHNTLLAMMVGAYDVVDRGYWPAHVAEAEYQLFHNDREAADDALKLAIAANPRDIPTLAMFGNNRLEAYDLETADAAVQAIREVNPTSPQADLLDARALLRAREPAAAEAAVKRVLDKRPDDLEALGLMAAAHACNLQDDKAKEVLAKVDHLDPGNAHAYFEVAERLSDQNQYPRAAAMYKVAIDRAPWWSGPKNGLGLLLVQDGDEEQAKTVLDAAYAVDPFNMRTINFRRLLEKMEAFTRTETAHFIFLNAAVDDLIVKRYIAPYMESIYPEVTKDFAYQPGEKTRIEIFPNLDTFSVRFAGQPGVENYGVNLGRVVAMMSPRPGEAMGNFNWARVIRHEFTHRINEAATENRCPRWLTEGLAVSEEKVPYRFAWILPVLYESATTGELIPLRDLNDAFRKPKKPTDGELAYMEGFWITQYALHTYGPDAVIKLLDAYKRGADESNSFQMAYGVSTEDFQKGFFNWAKLKVDGWGYGKSDAKKYDELKKEGDALIAARKYEAAAAEWEKIAKLRPVDDLPHKRLAGLYMKLGRDEDAAKHLRELSRIELSDNRYAKRIATIFQASNKPDKALPAAIQAVYINPYDPAAHELLADIYDATDQPDKAAGEREVVEKLKARAEKQDE